MNLSKNLGLFRTLALGVTAAFALACAGEMSGEITPEELAALESEQSEIFGSDACKNIDITVENEFEVSGSTRRVKVLKFEFYSSSEGRWLTEDVSNQEINVGGSRTWSNEDLQYAENDRITQVKIHYQYQEFDGDWSDSESHIDNIADVTCRADQNFNLTLE